MKKLLCNHATTQRRSHMDHQFLQAHSDGHIQQAQGSQKI